MVNPGFSAGAGTSVVFAMAGGYVVNLILKRLL